MVAPLQFEAGQKFGELTVVRRDDGSTRWLCACSCGKSTSVAAAKLKSGHTKSCGHLLYVGRPKTHGDTESREYRIWTDMLQRCFNPKRRFYSRYGGRGITVCDRWRNDYAAFLADMGRTPFPDAQIDRTNNDGDYEPGNCRWVSRTENMRNRGNARFVEYGGRRLRLFEWSEELGVPTRLLQVRFHRGWTDEEIITGVRAPVASEPKPNARLITHDGETRPIQEWAKRIGLPVKTLQTRYDRGWSHSEIVVGKRNKGEHNDAQLHTAHN